MTDFGIAKVLNAQTKLTVDQQTLGSPCYMSPEQCGVGEVVPASDLFSLGVTTFELIKKITQDDAPALGDLMPDMPPVVQAFIGALVEKDLARRRLSRI